MGKKRRHLNANSNMNANSAVDRISNGLAEAVGMPSMGNVPVNGIIHNMPNVAWGGGSQVSQAATLQRNLRNYLISNNYTMLSQAYIEIGLIQTIVDVPVEDAFKGGITVTSQQLDEQDLRKLYVALEREGDLTEAAQATKWKRLYGGGALIIITDQDPAEPLDLKRIGPDEELEFRAADMWELFYNSWDETDERKLQLGLDQEIGNEHYNYYGEKIHRSRVIKLHGKRPPSYLRSRLRGWGVSVVESAVRSINQYLKATDLTFEVLDEFKLDIFKVKGLAQAVATPNGTQKIQERLGIANWQKNYQNALAMDSEDDFDHKQLSFTGLAEVMTGNRMQVASDLRIPITKLFGMSAAGFNSGEDDIEVYNGMIESAIRQPLKYDLLRIIEIRCQQLFGMIPDDLTVEFKPLRILSAEQEENIKEKKFNRLLQAKQAGELTTLEFRNAVNRGHVFDIQLETEDEELLPEDADTLRKSEPAIDEVDDEEEFDEKLKVPIEETKADLKLVRNSKAPIENAIEVPITTTTKVVKKAVGAKYARVMVLPQFFTEKQKRKRKKVKNSAAFDKAAYEADGGDGWIDPRRKYFFENPNGVDRALWAEALEQTHNVFGGPRWQFTAWIYRKLGGRFN